MATRENLMAVVAVNKAHQDRARQLNLRAGETIFSVMTVDEMTVFLQDRLAGATSVANISNPDILQLDQLDEEMVGLVVKDNPDSIQIFGQSYPVEYREPYYGTPRLPLVRIDFRREKAKDWLNLPDEIRLPGGREVVLYSVIDGYGYYIEAPSSQFKEKARECLNQKLWDSWEKPEVDQPDPSVDDSEIPLTTACYGKCVVTEKDLTAYGTCAWNSYRYYNSDPWFKPFWSRDKAEAEKIRTQSMQKLEEIRAEAKKQRETEVAKAEAEVSRSNLKELSNREDWRNLDYGLRRKVEDRQYSYLPSSAEDLYKDKAETDTLIAEVEAAFMEIQKKREEESRLEAKRQERRAEGSKRLQKVLSRHLAECPFCGQTLEWSEEDCKRIIDNGNLYMPCQCSPEETLSGTLDAISAGISGQSINFDGREATVIRQLLVDGATAIQFALYYKYGRWNLAGIVDVDVTLADGKAEWVEVWREPSSLEIRLANLRREAETYAEDIAQAERMTKSGGAHKLVFRKGRNPQSGAEQWESEGRVNNRQTKFVVDQYGDYDIVAGTAYFCHEKRILVDKPNFRLIVVTPYLTAGRNIMAEIAMIEDEIALEQEIAKEQEESNPSSMVEEPKSGPVDLKKVDLSGLFGGQARVR